MIKFNVIATFPFNKIKEAPDMPGLYRFYCKKNQRYYIGETRNLRTRFSTIRSKLRNGKMPNAELLYDWERFGEDEFYFEILNFGEQFRDRAVRLALEAEYILLEPNINYNVTNNPTRLPPTGGYYGHSAKTRIVNGIVYKNTGELALAYGISRHTAKARLKNPNFNWPEPLYSGQAFADLLAQQRILKATVGHNFTVPVFANGKIYSSVNACARALGISRSTVYRNLRNKNQQKNFYYVDSNGNPISVQEVSESRGEAKRPVLVFNVRYESIGEAARAFDVTKRTIMRRCESIRNKNFHYIVDLQEEED